MAVRRPKRVGAYRSGLEAKLAEQIEQAGIEVRYEQDPITYAKPESMHTYKPDFTLPNGVVIEGKGIFDKDDRDKHLLVRDQYPELDIRFVFSRSKSPIYRGSKTTYADWCIKHGFQFADKVIPKEWFK